MAGTGGRKGLARVATRANHDRRALDKHSASSLVEWGRTGIDRYTMIEWDRYSEYGGDLRKERYNEHERWDNKHMEFLVSQSVAL